MVTLNSPKFSKKLNQGQFKHPGSIQYVNMELTSNTKRNLHLHLPVSDKCSEPEHTLQSLCS